MRCERKTTITITIQDREINLTEAEARELLTVLEAAVGPVRPEPPPTVPFVPRDGKAWPWARKRRSPDYDDYRIITTPDTIPLRPMFEVTC